MSTVAAAPATTKIIGYFNGNKYPIHLVISSLGITLRIEPGDYIRDRRGQKINDPIFDSYKQLSREESAELVPVIAIPVPKPGAARINDGHAVREVTEFTLNKHGFREPVMPQPKNVVQPSASNPSVKGMSMEEARKLRLIRPTRVVPEDYGVPDTDAALPPQSGIPEIKLAVDAPNPGGTSAPPPPALPPELTQMPTPEEDARVAKTAGVRQQLQRTLAEGSTTPTAAEDSGFLNTVIRTAVQEARSVQVPAGAMPLPALDDLPEPAVEPVPESVDISPPKAPPQPLPKRKKYICSADGRSFDFRSQLDQHVRRKYAHLYDDLMKPYPPES